MSKNNILEVKNLVKHFPVKSGSIFGKEGIIRAVDGISLDVPASSTLGVVGESGSGKSTLGKTILMLNQATAGSVYFKGHNLFDATPALLKTLRQQMQCVFQDPFSSLNPRLKIKELLTEPLALHNIGSSSSRADQAVRMIEKVGLSSHAFSKYPHEFSGGQRQRICIARALILNPDFVLLDEAVSALDVSVQSQILNLLVDLQKEIGLTYMFISHDLSVIRHISDRVAVIYLGKIVETGSADDVFNRPAHPYTQALLSANLSLDPDAPPDRIRLKGEIPNALNLPSGCRFHTRCPKMIPLCREKEPSLVNIGNRHFAACKLLNSSQKQEEK